MDNSKKWKVGIDEAGRGALAGPVSVGMCAVPPNFSFAEFSFVDDSKVLSHSRRDTVFKEIQELAGAGIIKYQATLVGSAIVDREGIVYAVQLGIQRVLREIEEESAEIFLDGLLSAPRRFTHQETIEGGDTIVPVISLASICAKVVRDRKMERLCKKYPEYNFSQHKGYGTKAHRAMIEKSGICEIHRRSFCTRIQLE